MCRVSQEERSVFWEVLVSAILRKKVYMTVCPVLNGFRYWAQYFEFGAQYFPTLSMSNHKSQLTLHTDSYASDSGALWWEGREILRPKCRKPYGTGHLFIYIFLT
jgi:hypothetical protein